jgi:predicted metal-binding protein
MIFFNKKSGVSSMQSYKTYLTRAKELGARDAKIISVNIIATAEWVRLKCQFGCGGYGKTLTCPPCSPTPEQTANALSYYKHAVILHGNGYTDISEIVATLEREIFLNGFHKAFGMGSGPCDLCDRCPKFCNHPYRARPSMEACGIDVYTTARNNGLPIEVVTHPDCECNYYGVVLIE